jgi:hypothetical protein
MEYGGGPQQDHAQHPHSRVDSLQGPQNGEADVRHTLIAGEAGDAWAFNGRESLDSMTLR